MISKHTSVNELHLSPDGLDDPKRSGSADAPLASLSGALDRIRLLKRTASLDGPLTVWVHGGVYPLRETVVVTPEHSGPVTFKAVPGETPVFDGGIRIAGWRPCTFHGRTVWTAPLPAAAIALGPVNQLFVNQRRRKRACLPKSGFLRIASPEPPARELFAGSDRFNVPPGGFPESVAEPEAIEAVVTHKWIEETLPLESYDHRTRCFVSTRRSRFLMDPADTEYRLENVGEALSEPGEYFHSVREGRLYYVPEADEDMETAEAVVPGLGCLLRFDGAPERNAYVEWIRFEGLTFRHGGAGAPAIGCVYDFKDATAPVRRNFAFRGDWRAEDKPLGGAPQGAVHLPGTLFMHGARHCAFVECTVAHSGWYAIEIGAGCTGVVVDGNHLHDLGGGGLRIGGADAEEARQAPSLLTSLNRVANNHIHDCGAIHFSAIGVLVTHAFGNLIERNHIHDLFYSGISCGWNWGYGESVTRENRIGHNRIHDLGKGVISDMGGIYLLGVQPGTRVYGNVIADVTCRYYGGWGVYTDEGSAHIVIERNVCRNCSSEGFHQHYGRENIVRHNIFAFNAGCGVAVTAGRSRKTGYALPGENYAMNLVFFGNIVVQDGRPFFRQVVDGAMEPEQFYSENNLFWDVSGASGVFAELGKDQPRDWDGWRALGHDRTSRFENPGFVDPSRGDFAFPPDSPAALILPHPQRPAFTTHQSG
ncbi:MAG: right-handed parallel beta-helix repeat-containing protein [Kiritimatiellia bacterium]|jgi:hypothetical protein